MHWSPPEGTTFLIMVSPVPGKLTAGVAATYLYTYLLDSIVAVSYNDRVTFAIHVIFTCGRQSYKQVSMVGLSCNTYLSLK